MGGAGEIKKMEKMGRDLLLLGHFNCQAVVLRIDHVINDSISTNLDNETATLRLARFIGNERQGAGTWVGLRAGGECDDKIIHALMVKWAYFNGSTLRRNEGFRNGVAVPAPTRNCA